VRYGHSLCLGFVDAEAVSYEDTRNRLITCPACAEAVVKVVRTRPDRRVSDYSRHYREAPAEPARRCELRVAIVTARQVETSRTEARGLALAPFIARFENCIYRAASNAGQDSRSSAMGRTDRRCRTSNAPTERRRTPLPALRGETAMRRPDLRHHDGRPKRQRSCL
jgi:hypothetical protein